MSVLIREIRANLKVFAVWALVIASFLFVGTVKYSGAEAGGPEAIGAIMESFPRIILAMFGMADVDITTFPGFFSTLEFYVAIMVSVFAVQLGSSAVARELAEGTGEFLFTRPVSRSSILACKLLADAILLGALCALNLVVGSVVRATLEVAGGADAVVGWHTLWIALIAVLFLLLSSAASAVAPVSEWGFRAGAGAVLVAYAGSVAYDVFGERAAAIRLITPLRYFPPSDLIEGRFEPLFLVVCVTLSVFSCLVTFLAFDRRDLVGR